MEAFVEVAGKLLGRRISEEAELTALRSRGLGPVLPVLSDAQLCVTTMQPFRVLATPRVIPRMLLSDDLV